MAMRCLALGLALVLNLGVARAPAAVSAASAPPSVAVPDPALAAFKQAIRQLYDLKERAWAAGESEGVPAAAGAGVVPVVEGGRPLGV